MNQQILQGAGCIAGAFALVLSGATPALAKKELPPTHYRIAIDPKLGEKELLPTPPQAAPLILLPDELARVPEVRLHEPFALTKVFSAADESKLNGLETGTIQNARLTARINHVNKNKTDRFIELLREHRNDLAGLPFAMGDACRLKKGDRAQFKRAVEMVQSLSILGKGAIDDRRDSRWEQYDDARKHKVNVDLEDRFCAAACMQMMATDSTEHQLGLVERLAAFSKTDRDKQSATRALTQLAVFSQDDRLRHAAVAALQKRDLGADRDILLSGLRYPWPAVAQKTAETVAELKRHDLVPELIQMLEEPDPRAPQRPCKSAPRVREVVKINHHRNCLLCHPPGNTPDVLTVEPWDKQYERKIGTDVVAGYVSITKEAGDVLVGAIPNPAEELSSGFDGYRSFRSPDILVRADVTYLRQDFSRLEKVADAKPWPELQRFDYLVRSRVLTDKEAADLDAALAERGGTPYRDAALGALRRLTGQNAGPTAAAWRAALERK